MSKIVNHIFKNVFAKCPRQLVDQTERRDDQVGNLLVFFFFLLEKHDEIQTLFKLKDNFITLGVMFIKKYKSSGITINMISATSNKP